MHLDTITEILNIPNHKVAGVIKSDPQRSYVILERIEDSPSFYDLSIVKGSRR